MSTSRRAAAAPVGAPLTGADLLAAFQAMQARAASPVRARDAAEMLGTSEGALSEARRPTGETVALKLAPGPAGFLALLDALADVGPVMALTRNASCVHETSGHYARPVADSALARVEGAIDQRLDLSFWRAAFAVSEMTPHGPHRSIQIFDAAGDAVQKLYATEDTDHAAFARLIAAHAAEDAPPATFDAEIVEAAMSELLTARPQGRALAQDATRLLLEGAAEAALPLEIVVGNRGCVQAYRGPVETIKITGAWVNVLDPDFNLHLRWDRIARCVDDGAVMRLWDADGTEFCRFGAAGDAAGWRALAERLPLA